MNPRFKLYVEGRDDSAVTCQLALKHQDLREPKGKTGELAPKFEVHEDDPHGRAIHGVDQLIGRIPLLLRDKGVDRIGFVVDADDAVATRWNAIHRALIAAGYSSTPLVADADGTIIEQPLQPRVGVWIMPDNRSSGVIENFIEAMIRPDDILLPQANCCVDEAILIERRIPDGPHHRQKAVIHTWLAWQKKSGQPQGVAIREGYVDATSDPAQRYIAWLVRLFG